jgi:hypothetical protein
MSKAKSSTLTKAIVEFGDFQTPLELAKDVCDCLRRRGLIPNAVLEPTCGEGSFLLAATQCWPKAKRLVGIDTNEHYLARAGARLAGKAPGALVELLCKDFFAADWRKLLADLHEPLLILGNPPWVTNSGLGLIGGDNLPEKKNFQKLNGLDAITGKSNFDISEWMILHLLEIVAGHNATLAMLCKTSVARKVLQHFWKQAIPIGTTTIHRIDAAKHFGVAVDACLLTCQLKGPSASECHVYDHLNATTPEATIGLLDNTLLANVAVYRKSAHLVARTGAPWRSGVKHDCSKVMEFRKVGRTLYNGLGEHVELEDDYMFPLLKGSDIANGRTKDTDRWMLVPQSTTGQETATIRDRAPKTWKYLIQHGEYLDKRSSSIYRGRARFSIFGVGDYTFAPWKVAICGLYKRLQFEVVGPHDKKPIVLDDTSYFLSFDSCEESHQCAELLNSERAKEFFSAFIFWDSKRPITADVLKRFSLPNLSLR